MQVDLVPRALPEFAPFDFREGNDTPRLAPRQTRRPLLKWAGRAEVDAECKQTGYNGLCKSSHQHREEFEAVIFTNKLGSLRFSQDDCLNVVDHPSCFPTSQQYHARSIYNFHIGLINCREICQQHSCEDSSRRNTGESVQ
mmetsp:Transcript_45961/g.121971  ORF Transcript_45961/g.121971 Transcript_45961/m.121971 type:complete len:141 (-) Transcript_45961:205-627(-)